MGTLSKPTAKLTPKQQEFVKQLIDNPRMSGTQAALKAYDTDKPEVASAIATENLRKPSIVNHLEDHSILVESVIIGTIKDWQKSNNTRQREIATNLAMYTHDKVHGKATQRIEQQSTSVHIEIDLT